LEYFRGVGLGGQAGVPLAERRFSTGGFAPSPLRMPTQGSAFHLPKPRPQRCALAERTFQWRSSGQKSYPVIGISILAYQRLRGGLYKNLNHPTTIRRMAFIRSHPMTSPSFPNAPNCFITDERESTDSTLFDKLKWLTSKEAAFLLRTSVGQVRNLVWKGRLKSFHFGTRLRFLRSDVENLLKPAF